VTPKVLFIRADANQTLGTGHLMRMLALGEAWVSRGGSFVVGGSVPTALVERVQAAGGVVSALADGPFDGEQTRDAARAAHATVVVADGYRFGPDFQRAILDAGLPLMVVDDNAENHEYPATFVLNQNVHASEGQYSKRGSATQLLLGPRYALVRREILDGAKGATFSAGAVARCLVTLGGADPLDLTGRLLPLAGSAPFSWCVLVGGANPRLSAYQRAAPANVELVFNSTRFAHHARQCQLAFAAAGSTVWELALLGVPAAVVSVADNQVELGRALGALGAVEYLGDARESGTASSWLQRLTALAQDEGRRRSLVDSARAIVDGAGAQRVVEKLLEVV